MIKFLAKWYEKAIGFVFILSITIYVGYLFIIVMLVTAEGLTDSIVLNLLVVSYIEFIILVCLGTAAVLVDIKRTLKDLLAEAK